MVNNWNNYISGWWFGTCFIFFPSHWGHVIVTPTDEVIFFTKQYNIWYVILPIDEVIFFKMVIAPPTSSLFTNPLTTHHPLTKWATCLVRGVADHDPSLNGALGALGWSRPQWQTIQKRDEHGLNGKQQHVPIAEQNPDLSVPRFVGRIAVVFSGCMVIKKSKQTCFDDNGKKVRGPLQESTCWHARSRTLAPLPWPYRRQCTYLCFNPEVTPRWIASPYLI